MSGHLALALLLAAQAAAGAAVPNEVKFADYELGGWHIEATTRVEQWRADDGNLQPVVREISCTASRDGMIINTDRSGRTQVRIQRPGEDSQSFSTLNIRALRIGQVTYQAHGVDVAHGPYRFSDVHYPEGFAEVVTTSFSGYLAVQRGGQGPWLSADSPLADLLRARSVEVGYRVWNEDSPDRNGWHLEYHTIPLAGFSRAVERCRAEIVSDNAYRLHPR